MLQGRFTAACQLVLATEEQMPWPPMRPWASKAISLSQRHPEPIGDAALLEGVAVCDLSSVNDPRGQGW